MYRVPKMPWLDGVVRGGRERGQMTLAHADVGGVRILLKALKRGGAIGLLPDQVPGGGEGEWEPFFGRPAYTMTLAGRLAEASGATVLLSYSERLPHGAGYIIHFTPLEFTTEAPATRQLNAALEKIIRACPTQYLWSYNRYKTPAGAKPPQEKKEING
jgi:KDO2-lipid IV(A) lauroyltransferase